MYRIGQVELSLNKTQEAVESIETKLAPIDTINAKQDAQIDTLIK